MKLVRSQNELYKISLALESAAGTLKVNIQSPEAKNELSKNFFYRIRPTYYRTLDRLALSQGVALSHLYEIGRAGSPRHRLFRLAKGDDGVKAFLMPAKLLVPLSDWQKTPGPTGRRVTKRYRFPAWPFVREFGIPTTIKRKPETRWLAPGPPIGGGGKGFLKGPVINTNKGSNIGAFQAATKNFFSSVGSKTMQDIAEKHKTKTVNAAEKAAVAGAYSRQVKIINVV